MTNTPSHVPDHVHPDDHDTYLLNAWADHVRDYFGLAIEAWFERELEPHSYA